MSLKELEPTSHSCELNAVYYMGVVCLQVRTSTLFLLLQTSSWNVHLCIYINLNQQKTDCKNLIRKWLFSNTYSG